MPHDHHATHPPQSRAGQSINIICAKHTVQHLLLFTRNPKRPSQRKTPHELLALGQRKTVRIQRSTNTSRQVTQLTLPQQILPLPRLPNRPPPPNPNNPLPPRPYATLHLPPRQHRSRHRSHPAHPTNPKKPRRKILQGFPPQRHRQLGGGRCHEDELFLPQQRIYPLAVQAVWHLSGVL
jgi:hypothetical protein